MDDKGDIKRSLMIIFAGMVILSVAVYAVREVKIGQCIQECTHVYNPSFMDYKNNTQFPIDGFIAQVCVKACKDNTYQGACSEKPGDCCNIFRQDIDTDCHDTDFCSAQTDCKSSTFFYCDLIETSPTCKPKLLPGISCTENYQCLSNACDIPQYTNEGICA